MGNCRSGSGLLDGREVKPLGLLGPCRPGGEQDDGGETAGLALERLRCRRRGGAARDFLATQPDRGTETSKEICGRWRCVLTSRNRKRGAKKPAARPTQLRQIRDLMLAAARRGMWLTLSEIARLTDAGEASVSAQLRHLRKRTHGRHRVDKRLRGQSKGHPRLPGAERQKWEYRVLPRAGAAAARLLRET